MTNNGNTGSSTVGININLGVNGAASVTQATQQIQALNGTIAQTGQANVARPIQTLRQELRQATNEASRLAAAGQQNTAAYAAASRRVTELRNAQDELNNSLKAFDVDNKFRVAANAASAAARATQGYTGALAFLGVEGEDAAQTLAKLQGITAFADGIDGLLDLQDSFKDLLRVLGLNLTATNAQTTATGAQAAANTANAAAAGAVAGATSTQAAAQTANATATAGATTATQAATVATNGFGLALKMAGIGLIVAALVALYYNFDKLKVGIDKLFPGLGGIDKLFGKIVTSVYGVGAAVKKVFSGLADVIGDVLSGNFSKIGEDLSKAFDVSDAFRKGVEAKVKSDAEDAKITRIKNEIETNERIIKERRAAGIDTFKLEVANQKLKIAALDKDDKDYKKNKGNAESELTVLINGEEKKRSDKAKEIAKAKAEKEKAQRLADLEAIKKNNEDALKIVAAGSQDERNVALADLDIKYKKEFELLQKRKKDIKDFNVEFNNLTNARKLEESKINKKYDDEINEYLRSVQVDTLSSYDKTINEIDKIINEKLKTATPEQKALLETSRTEQTGKLRTLESLDNTSQAATTDLTIAENQNRPNDNDTPEEATAKIANIAQAKLDAENAAFELKKVQLQGQNAALAQLNADHEKSITGITESESDARKNIAKAEQEARLATFEAVGRGLGTLSSIVGEQSAAGKALGVASATIDTYIGATKALAQGGIYGYIGAAAIIATGLANVKKILSVKIPVANGSAGSSSTSVPTAPVINSTILQQANNGSQNIVDAVKTNNQQVVRAYIVDKDLSKQADKNKMIDSLSKI